MSGPQKQPENFGKGIPIFPVQDASASVEFFVKVLGFAKNWHYGEFASVSRGECTIFLCADEQGKPGTWAFINVDDVDALAAQWQAAGAKLRMTPQNFIWGYEAHVPDIDGNVLRIAQDHKPGPFGAWTRDDGSRWHQLQDGSWERAE